MYKRTMQGWLKHVDFILVDEAALQVALILAYAIRFKTIHPYASETYRTLALLLALFDLLTPILISTMHDVLKRNPFIEFVETLKHCGIVFVCGMVFFFSTKTSEDYSRITLYLTFGFHILVGFLFRIMWKRWILWRGKSVREKDTMLVVLSSVNDENIIRQLTDSQMEGYHITGIVTDQPGVKEINGISVVAELKDAAAYICREWIDSVYIDCPLEAPGIRQLIRDCREMAVPVHYHISGIGEDSGKQLVEQVGDTMVLTITSNYASTGSLILKRMIDILGGIVGSILALLIMAIVGPIIKIASPGPILYRQERIGRNGKHIRIAKIRSMYMDADARKGELLKQNRVKDGMMFKLDFDPRIIGNKVLSDGTKKTGIGEFIRKTSLDEFPQFFNVLKGDMSIVGTRPPTVDEWEKYEFHHRARLACKPGITGMWQVSGRSEITDFEQVVKLDTEYINNWSIGLDIKILFKTFGAVLGHKGAM